MPPADSGLDPAVRARLERLAGPAGQRRAQPGDPPTSTAGRSGGDGDAGVPGGVEPGESAVPGSPDALLGRAWRLSKRHAWAIALLVLVGIVASSGLSLRARAVEVAAPVVSSRLTDPAPVSASPSASPSVALVTVHVLGAVLRPGVVSVVAPARVRDAVQAAGGFTADADPGELNLAAPLSDGSQILIGTRAQPRGEVRGGGAAGSGATTGGTAGAAPKDGLLDLNTATIDQLDQLPGVGPVTAQAILQWRTKHGRFSSVEELQEVDGIGPKTYAQIAPHVRV